MILRERALPSVKFAGSLAWFITLLASSANGADEELPYESSLLPPVTTYVNLLLCANTSQRYRNNDADAERYRQTAFEVQDMTDEAGWSPDAIAATMTRFQETRSDLDLRTGDSPEVFYRRNFSVERCEQELNNVEAYKEKGLPPP